MTRPRGEIREAIVQAAQQLQAEQGGANWREMAQRACVGYDKARQTVRDMVKVGELQPCGQERVAHARRPMVRYALGRRWETPGTTGGQGLYAVMRTWR